MNSIHTEDSLASCGSDRSVVETPLFVDEETKPKEGSRDMSCFNIPFYCRTIAPIGNGMAWLGNWFGNAMHLYDKTGQLIKSVFLEKGKEIWDIVVRKSGEVIVCNNDKRIRLVTETDEVSTIIDTSPLQPKCVCLTSEEEIVVCIEAGQGHFYVSVFSPDGKSKSRDVTVTDNEGRPLLTDPIRVVMNGEDIAVLNWDSKKSNIVMFDQSGNVKWLYDGSQANLDKEFKPYGLCVDKLGHCLISDLSTHCVDYIDKGGILIQLLLTGELQGLQGPSGIAVDDASEKIWVGSELHKKIWIAKYL